MRWRESSWIPVVVICLYILAIASMYAVYEWGKTTRDVNRQLLQDALRTIEELQQDDAQGGAEIDDPAPQVTGSGWTWPIAESDYLALTSPHGYRESPILGYERWHQGVDIAGVWRAQVVASADGIVVEHWPPPDGYFRGHEVYGGLVVIEHAYGWRTLYAHLSESRVRTGQTVRAGEIIGRIGDTGQARGVHLHYEMIGPDGPVNPLIYVGPRAEP